jgi:hypothetical protein
VSLAPFIEIYRTVFPVLALARGQTGKLRGPTFSARLSASRLVCS